MAFHGFPVWAYWLWKKCYSQFSGSFSRRSELCWIFWHRVYYFPLHYFGKPFWNGSFVDFRKILVWVDLSINELFWFRNWIRTSRVFSHKQHFKIAWTGLLFRWQRKDVHKCKKRLRYFGLLYIIYQSYTTKVPIVIAGNWHFNYIDRGQVSGRVLTFPYTNFVHSDMKDPRILQKMMTEIGAIIHRCLMLYRK